MNISFSKLDIRIKFTIHQSALLLILLISFLDTNKFDYIDIIVLTGLGITFIFWQVIFDDIIKKNKRNDQ